MSYQNYQNNEKIRRKKKKNLPKFRKLPPVDKNILIVITMLIIFGIVAIFSASVPESVAVSSNPLYYPIKHIQSAVIGIILMIGLSIYPPII